MTVRAKTKRRVILLAVVTFLVVAAGATFYVVRKAQIRRQFMGYREQGMAAFDKKDYPAAVAGLSRYFSRYPQDYEASFRLAQALRNLDRTDPGLLQREIYCLRRVLNFKPDHKEASLMLLEAYVDLGYNTEANDLAQKLLADAQKAFEKKAQEQNTPKTPWVMSSEDLRVLASLLKAKYGLRERPEEQKKTIDRAIEYVKADPANLEIQRLLLFLLNQNGRNKDIIAQAEFPLDRAREEAKATTGATQPTAQKYPNDGRFELLLGIAYSMAEDWTAAQQAKARKLVAELNPKATLDPFDRGVAARELFKYAAERIPPDTYYVQVLVAELDRLGLPTESLMVLERAQAGGGAESLKRLLVRRLWEAEQYEKVDKALATLDPKAETSDPEMLAFRAISLIGRVPKDHAEALQKAKTPAETEAANAAQADAKTKATAEAKAIAEALAGRKNAVASAWGLVLSELYLAEDGKGDIKACAEKINEVIGQRGNPYLRYFLADAYIRLQEYDQASELLNQVLAANPTWARPALLLSLVLSEMGQREYATAAAELALMRNQTVAYAANYVAMAAQMPEARQAGQAAKILDYASRVRMAAPTEEQSLPAYVALSARVGKRAEAEKALRAALEAPRPPQLASLLKLVAASREASLGLEEACFQLAEKTYGMSPELGFAKAVDLLLKGRGGEGVTLLESHQKKNQDPKFDLPWRLAHARYLEQMKDDRAADAWQALGDDPALKANLFVQRTVLAAPSVQSRRDLTDRTIERIRALTGEHAVSWRVSRARWYLQANRKEDTAQAITILQKVIATLPTNADARQLLSIAMERSGNTVGAIEQMTAAGKMRPMSNAIILDLARLYQSQSDAPRAREQIDRLSVETLTPAQRRLVVGLLAQQGESDRALSLLESAPAAEKEAAEDLTAVLLLRKRNPQKAEELLQKLLVQENLADKDKLGVIQVAAHFFGSLGRKEEAKRQLARLDELKGLEPGVAESTRAWYYARYGTPEEALAQFRKTIDAAPHNPLYARSLVMHHLRMNQLPEAIAAAEQAVRRLKDAPRPATPTTQRAVAATQALAPTTQNVVPTEDIALTTFVRSAGLIRSIGNDVELPLLVAAIINPPTDSDSEVAAEALRIAIEGKKQATLTALPEMIQKLRPLADRSPRLIPVQRYLIRRYMQIGRMDDAITLAKRCLSIDQRSPELAQLAAEVFATAGEWSTALDLATRWHDLLVEEDGFKRAASAAIKHSGDEQCLLPDLLIADLQLRLNNAAAAIKQLEAFFTKASENAEAYRGVLALRVRALVMQGDKAKASELLWPHVTRAPHWRAIWISLWSVAGRESAPVTAWLERITPVVPEAAQQEQVGLADAWYQAGNRFRDPQLLSRARAILDRLMARPDAAGFVFMARAVMHEGEGNEAAAEPLYRRALALQAELPLAQNNLAMILARRETDLKSALDLASKAVQAQPNVAAMHDTVAFVQLKLKDYKSAAASLRAAMMLEPDKYTWRFNLAETLIQAGERNEASRVLRDIETLLPTLKEVPKDAMEQIKRLRGLVGLPTAAPSATLPTTRP